MDTKTETATGWRRYWHWRTLAGAVLGAAGGYAYYYFIGCSSGSCPITSNPYASVVWGTLAGALLLSK